MEEERKKAVVTLQLRESMLEENHSGPMGRHFSGARLYKCLVRHWWWVGMFSVCQKHCTACPQCEGLAE